MKTALPRGPVLDWSSWRSVGAPPARSPEDLPYTAFTTSGRAAIFHALRQLALPPGTTVLVPTYHCPTMVAPIYMAGLTPAYFGLRVDGLPLLEGIDSATAARTKAIIVPHYFGLAQSLAEVRSWCDARSIALIEDCAHCYFGDAGERPVGAWGDYCIASLSKFFPVSEAGLLASARRPITPLKLLPATLGAQAKGFIDVFESASRHSRFAGLGGALALLFRVKNRWLTRGASPVRSEAGTPASTAAVPAHPSASDVMHVCDMARISQTPLWSSTWLRTRLPRGRIRVLRQRNFTVYERQLAAATGARPLLAPARQPAAPYVYPLWVDDADAADALYAELRAQRLPVFRWDRLWPDTPVLRGDVGLGWSRQVLQLLCHQDLSEADVTRTAQAVQQWLRQHGAEVAARTSPALAHAA